MYVVHPFLDVDLTDIAVYMVERLMESYPDNEWFAFVSNKDLSWASLQKSDWQLLIRNQTCGRDLLVLK